MDRKGMLSWVILATLLCTFAWKLLYHQGAGSLEAIQQDELRLYVRMSNGHLYPAPACRDEAPLGIGSDRYVKFTAIGLDLFISGRQISWPVIFRCEFGGWIEGGPLP